MRNRILSAALGVGLALGIGIVSAQTINSALQLSQDATGAFAVDTNNNVYFPGHILTPTKGQVLPTVTGTGTPTVSGTDFGGLITMGSSATTATLVFGKAYVSLPACVVSWPGTLASEIYVLSTTSIAITQTSTSGNKINYICTSNS